MTEYLFHSKINTISCIVRNNMTFVKKKLAPVEVIVSKQQIELAVMFRRCQKCEKGG